METTAFEKNISAEQTEKTESRPTRRPRNMTCVKLQWLAERIRRCEAIKKSIAEGTYSVDSTKVARALLNLDLADEPR